MFKVIKPKYPGEPKKLEKNPINSRHVSHRIFKV